MFTRACERASVRACVRACVREGMCLRKLVFVSLVVILLNVGLIKQVCHLVVSNCAIPRESNLVFW